MTFRKYSKLISSSDFTVAGELDLDSESRDSDIDDLGERGSDDETSVREAQYPTPGLRCRSRRAADDCTLRSSSRKVYSNNQSQSV